MSTTLTHPEAETLGRFIEGTLDEPERTAVVEHIADCDDCRIIVVDASEFFAEEHPADQQIADQQVRQHNVSGRWWMSAAAAIAIAVGGVWLVDARRDPLAPVKEASSKSSSRLVAARLSGFPYGVRKSPTRGGEAGEIDSATIDVEVKAQEVLQRSGNDARMQHAKGVAGLLYVQAELANSDYSDNSDRAKDELGRLRGQRDDAIKMLQSAANLAPHNAAYRSDFAAALIAKGDRPSLQRAVEACDLARKAEPRSADALFNRAKAKDLLAVTPSELTDALDAYNLYIKVDGSSPWANEARDRVKYLSEELKPQP